MSNVVFLSVGNPGPINRHSTGHYVLNELVSAFEAGQMTKKAKYSITNVDNVFFVRSNTYMNESGALIKALFSSERIQPCVVVVLFDDFELNFPKVRLQQFRKNESHNGLKSVSRELTILGIQAYKLGVGIGPKPQNASRDTMASWVLSKHTQEEKEQLQTSMEYVYKFVHRIIEADGEIGDCGKLNARISKEMAVDNEAS